MATSNGNGTSHKDIAKFVNVTQATVSRALDPKRCHMISECTRLKIEKAAAELGFRPNIHARRVRTLKSEALTLVIDTMNVSEIAWPDFHSHEWPIIMRMISGVIDRAAEGGYEVKLLPLHSKTPNQDLLRERIGFPYSDGVIFVGYYYKKEIYEIVRQAGIPGVIISGIQVPANPMPVILSDPKPGLKAAVSHLIEGGRRRIVFCSMSDALKPGFQNDRYQPCAEAALERGLEIPNIECPDIGCLRRHAERIAAEKSCDAIVCVNDSMAGVWARELAWLGVKVPGEIALVGFDGNPAYAGLASVAVPHYEMGRLAADLGIANIGKGPLAPDSKALETKFSFGWSA